MKKIIFTLFVLIVLGSTEYAYSQCNNCGTQYPAAVQSTTSGTTSTISTCMYGGEYAVCNVVAGSTYNWQTCGSAGFDTQLTLQQGTGCAGTDLAYNDDGCGLQSSITWTATFTGTVSILISQYNCLSNTTCQTLTWSCTSCGGGGGGGACPGAPTCSSSPPANDNCSTPTPICEFEGYCGNTSTAYTAANIPAGFCGSVENNSWLSFVASAATATLNVYVCNCTWGDGIQMEIYSSNNCNTFTSFSNCWNPGIETNGTVTANGLTPGNTYLLMIDGFAGDDCDYTISAGSGISTATAIVAQTGTNTASICLGQSVNLTASGGTGYSWTPTTGLSNPNIANPVATPTTTTVYNCNVTGGNPLCPAVATVSVTINVSPGLTVTSSGVNPSCNGGANGTATVNSVTGGTTPYTYAWPGGQTTQSVSGLAAGSYTVTVSSPNGCTATSTVTLTNPPPVTITLTPTSATCGSSNGSILVSVAGGTANYNYSCPPAVASNSNPSNSYTFNSLASGAYNVTVTTGAGCTATGSTTVGTTGSVTSTFTYNGNHCAGTGAANQFNFTNTGTSGGGATYSWTFTGGTPATSTTNNPTGVTWSTAGVYVVSHTVTQGTCTSTTTMNITAYPNPVPNVTTVNANCNNICNGVATANPTGGTAFSYLWSNGLTTQAITNLCDGTYTVTVTNTDGCTGTQTVTITEPAALALVTTRTDATCFGLCDGTANVSVTPVGSYTYNWSGGSTPNAATTSTLCVGTYTVTVTAAPGCTQTGTVTVGEPLDIVLTPTTTLASCGNPTGTATVNITNGFAPFNYVWNTVPAQNTQTATGLGSGAYTVTVTDSHGCIKTTTANVSSSNGPTASIVSFNDVVCNGQSNGSAIATASGGTAPLTYLWDAGTPPLNTTSVNGLSAGIHTITVTDALLCTATASVTISEPSLLTATTSPVGANCGQATGSIQANPNGGTPPYTYAWNSVPTQSTQTANALPPGVYTVIVTDSHLCSSTASGTISNLPGVNMAVKSTTNALCNGSCDGTAALELTGGLPSFTISCSNGYSITTASTNITISGLCAGSYTVTVTDGNSCQATATFTISQPAAVTATISSSTNVSCNGGNNGSATVTGGGGTSPYTALWNTIPAQTGLTASGLTLGTYSVTVTDFNNCTATNTVTISQPTAIALTTNKTNAHCGLSDGTASVSAIGGTVTTGYTYLWSGGTAPLTLSNVSGLSAAGSPYTVTVTDNNGCTATANVTISNIPPGTASISTFSNVNCFGQTNGSATVSIGGGQAPFTYLWNTVPAQNTSTATGLGVGTYTASITDANNCVVTANVTISEPAQISNSYTITNATCFGQCNGQIISSVSGGTTPYSYQWSNFQSTPSISNLCAGNFTLTVIDSHGCTQNFPATITQPSQIVITNVVTNAHCSQTDGGINITVNGGTLPYTFLWNWAGSTTQNLTNIPSGTYSVTVTDLNSCTSISSIQVNNITGPSASITSFQNVQCFGNNDGFATVTANGGSGMFSYQWNTVPVQNTATASNLPAGVYSVTVTDVSTNCIVNASVTITEPPDLTVSSYMTEPLCNGQCNGSAWVVPVGGTGPYTYQWMGGGSTPNDSLNTGLCAGNYTVIVTDANSCFEILPVTVTQPAFLSATISSTPLICYGLCNGTATVSPAGGTQPYTYVWSSNANSQTTSQAVGLCAGNYSVTISDNHGCSITSNTVVATPPKLIIQQQTLTHVKCYGQSTGLIIPNTTGGVPNYSYSWNNGATTQNLSNIPYGNYCVTVTDNNGCQEDTCFIISQPPLLQVSTTSHDETCSGLCNGYIVPNVLGGQQPYTYLWSNFDTQSTADSLCPNSYSLTVTDFNNCTAISYDTVVGHQILDVLIVTTDTATCGQANGSAIINAMGGTWTYTYQWPAGVNSISSSAANLAAGAYTVTVIDANNCQDSIQINISNAAGPVIDSISAQHVSCNGFQDGSLHAYYHGSTSSYSVVWNTNPPQIGDIATNLGPGNYSVVITDGNGCVTSSNKQITQPTLFQAAVTNHTNSTCYGVCNGTATAMANGGVLPYSFAWSSGDLTQTAGSLCAGMYSVTATDSHNCISTGNITITQPDSIQISASVTNVTCNGMHNGQIILTVTGGTGYVYNWFPNVSSNSVAALLQPGNYTAIISDISDMNCTTIGNYVITEPNPIVISTNYSPTTCGLNNGLAFISSPVQGGTSPFSFVWSPGNSTNDTVFNASAGTYSLQVTDANNCHANTNVVVSSRPAPTLQSVSVSNISCPGVNDGAAIITTISGSQPYSYSWSPFTGNDSIIDANNAVIYGLYAGIYHVTVTDMDGCQLQTLFNVTQPTPIIVHADGTRWICNGQYATISANATGGTLPYSFQWLGLPTTNPVQIVNPNTTTTYPVHAVDSRGCNSDTASVTIFVYPDVIVDVYADTGKVCKGSGTFLHAVPSGGNGGPYNFYWQDIGDTVPQAVREVFPLDTTTYYVYAVDNCGSPSHTDSVTVYVLPVPYVSIVVNKQAGCEPLEVFFHNVDTSSNVNFLWNFNDPSSNNNSTLDIHPSHIFMNSGSYNVSLQITTLDGCSASNNQTITVYPKPDANFNAFAVYDGAPFTASLFHPAIQFIDISTETISTREWNFGDNRTSGLVEPVHSYESPGTYNVSLFVRTDKGCTDSIIKEVLIIDEFTLYVPTAFDPNSPVNREFYPQGKGIDEKNYHLWIFDRWGEIMFETTDFNEHWNGKFLGKGDYVKSGSYVWYIWVKDTYGKAHEKTGPVTVIR